MHEKLVGTSRVPYTMNQIKVVFRKTVQETLKNLDIQITNRDIKKQDLQVFAEHDDAGSYYFLEEFCYLGQLNRQKLKDFVDQNIGCFTFYTSDVV